MEKSFYGRQYNSENREERYLRISKKRQDSQQFYKARRARVQQLEVVQEENLENLVVFENLQIINSDRKELYKQETIEVLSKLATSSNLRECFKDLVDYYLESFENKEFLVISVDDFDLNISGTFEMLEDIRQFLIQNKIVILIACKIEQLRESVLNNLYKEFEYLIKYKSSEIDENKLITKTEKYLEKLIPFEKRLELPNLKMF